MLRYCFSSCTSSHTWCYVICMPSCTSSHIWCYVIVCRLALPHIYDATFFMSSCTSSHIWCYVVVCRLALPHIHDATLFVCRLALPHIYDATLLYVVLHFLTYMMLRYCNFVLHFLTYMWKRDGRERPLMSIRAQFRMFGGWSKDPCLRIFIRRVLGIQPCSMARFGRTFALGSGDGKTVPTKTCPSSLHRLSRTLSAEKKSAAEVFYISSQKYARTF